MASTRRPTVPRPRTLFLAGSLHTALLAVLAASATAQAPVRMVTHVGTARHQFLGTTTAIVGDIDQDGHDDYLIGSPGSSPNGIAGAGSALLYSGRTGALLHRVDGTFAGEGRGRVAALGDVNGDDVPDYAVASPSYSADWLDGGSIWILSGATHTLLREHLGPAMDAKFGLVMAGVGDTDGDGSGDLAVGAAEMDVGSFENAGSVFVFSGATGDLIRRLDGVYWQQGFGFSLGGVGDMDDDGMADVIIGAPVLLGTAAPSVQLYSPKTGAALGGSLSWEDDHFGWAVAGVGDVNGDGTPDWMAGAPNRDAPELTDNGIAYLFSGATGSVLDSMAGVSSFDRWGSVIAGVGTVDEDGVPDFAVGSANVSLYGGYEVAGAAVVYSGADGTPIVQIGPDAAIPGEGDWISGGGDVNGDGRHDVIVSASGYIAPGPIAGAGRVDIFGFGSGPRASPASRALVAPNPMRRTTGTRITFDVPASGTDVRVTIHDVRGRFVRVVAHRRMDAGPNTVTWDGRNDAGKAAPGGVYFVRTLAGSLRVTNRLVLVP